MIMLKAEAASTIDQLKKWLLPPLFFAALTIWLMSRVFPVSGGTVQAEPEKGAKGRDVQKEIALTFDDGPHSVYTPQLLDGLRERGVQATFFLLGDSIEGKETIIKTMAEDGHLIGNHSQTHIQLTKEDVKIACDQIERTNQKIYEVTGERPSYIRPPFGSWSEELECMVPMTVVLWSIDPLDWKGQNTKEVVNHILKRADDGEIILLHDVYGTSVEAALEVVDTLTRQGYNFVTVDELLID